MPESHTFIVVEPDFTKRQYAVNWLASRRLEAMGCATVSQALTCIAPGSPVKHAVLWLAPQDAAAVERQWAGRSEPLPLMIVGHIARLSKFLNDDWAPPAMSPEPPMAASLTFGPLRDMTAMAIEEALRAHNGNRTHAARALGISVRTLQRKLGRQRLAMDGAHSSDGALASSGAGADGADGDHAMYAANGDHDSQGALATSGSYAASGARRNDGNSNGNGNGRVYLD